MNEIELAWLAGLLEGEGTFYAKNVRGAAVPAIGLAMTDADIVERVRILIGAKRTYLRPGRSAAWKDQYEIRVTGKRAVEIMRELLPYMGERRRAKIAELVT